MSKIKNNFVKDLEELSDSEDEDIFELNKQDDSIEDKQYQSSKLRNNKQFLSFLSEIENDLQNKNQFNPALGKENKVYSLISDSNRYITEINQDINIITKYIKELYSQRFPELESAVLHPYDYALTVKRLGNDLDVNKANLTDILPNLSMMTLHIMTSSTSGRPLKKDELEKVINACDEVIKLYEYKKQLLNYIESRMEIIAPNLSKLIGANIAAKLVTSVGGIIELSKTPSSNILVLGAQRQNLEGFSTAGKLHRGFLAEMEEIKSLPESFQIKALRKYAGKAAIAARVDAFRKIKNSSNDDLALGKEGTNLNTNIIMSEENNNANTGLTDSKEGEKLKEFINKKLARIQESKQPKIKKPLPRPDDKPRKKRGGKRLRNLKEKYEQTDLRKQANRMTFGTEAEVEFRDTGKGFGMLKTGGVGSKLKISVKSQKITSQKHRQVALDTQKQNQQSGLQSSVAFTPMQGMALINPELLEKKLGNAKDKYFSTSSGFSTVIAKKQGQDSLFNL